MKKLYKLVLLTSFISFIGSISPALSQCENGGRGSTSCSYTFTSVRWFGLWTVETTHSVSCGEGMYACCTNNGAGCVYNSPTIIQG